MNKLAGANSKTLALSLGFVATLLLTAMLSWPALSGPFLFDDFPNLENLASLNGRLSFASLANYASLYRGEPGRPLSMLSFVVNDYDWPTEPWSFKYTNLQIHLLIGVLVFGFSRALVWQHNRNDATAATVALLTMAAWLLHPMQLSTSMLVVQRMTQLAALFAFAGLWAYVSLVRRSRDALTATMAIACLGVGTLFSLLSKETGALVPLLAVVANVTLLRETLQRLPSAPRRILKAGTLLPVIALLLLIIVRWDSVTAYGNRPFDLHERVLSQTRALCEYLFNILIPNLRGGGIYHDDFAISKDLFSPWTTLPASVAVVSLIAIAVARHRGHPLLGFAVLWFFAGHLLESTIFPLELYFEHRNYLPMFGVIFALCTAAVEAKRGRRWKMSLLGIWLLFCGLLTAIQAPIWGNSSALVQVWAIEHPNSPRAIQHKAADLYDRGKYSSAAETLIDAYERGVNAPDFPTQVLLLSCLQHDAPLARRTLPLIDHSLRTGTYTRALPMTLRKLRSAIERRACPSLVDSDQWLHMTTLLLQNPYYSEGEAAAFLHTERSYYFRSRRDLNNTIVELERAWDANRTPEIAQLIAATFASAGLTDEARKWAEKALEARTRGVRGWFSQDDVKSRMILDAVTPPIGMNASKPSQ